MNTLSVENLSSSNLDHHEAGEIIHRGFEKATDKIAAGVEVVKRLLMQELPPVEGGNLMEKAENLKDVASEKIQEVKEKVEEKVESVKETSQEKTEEKVESVKETSQNFSSRPQQSGVQRGARTSSQTDLYRSGSGSETTWEPTQEMKDIAREKLGEFKERFQQGGEAQRESASPPQESAVLFEQGKEKELNPSSEDKLHEIEDLSLQLNKKVEELKKSAGMPTNQTGETIIIIQEGGVVPQQGQFQFAESQSFAGSQSQEQQRPMLGHRGEQEWRNQEQQGQSQEQGQNQEQQRPMLGHRGEQEWRNQQEQGQNQEQQRPKLGHRGEQEWRNSEGPSEEGQSIPDKISQKAQEIKEGFNKSVEKASSNMPSQESQSQPNEGERSLTGKLGDKIKEKVSDKANELKDSYQSNLQEIERKAEQRWSEQPKEHHESEHHLTTESQSFRPSTESRSLPKQELPSTEGHHESEHHLNPNAESFQPSRQSKSLLKKELGGQGSQQGQENLESQTSNLRQTLEGQASNLKGKLGEAAEQIKEKVLPTGQEGQGQSLKQQIVDKVDEVAEKIMPLDEAEKQYNESQEKEQTSAPPAEIHETITYHPQEIRGYEIEYVPKHQSEGDKSQSKDQEESQSKSEEESMPLQERIPFLDRVVHSFENANQSYQNMKGLFTHSQGGQGEQTSEETGYHAEHLRTGAPPAEIHENITYHPRDIRGYEVEYVPKNHNESEGSESHSQGSQNRSKSSQKQTPPVELKETITYHPRDIRGYEVEYVPKSHKEGDHSEGQVSEQESSQQSGSERVPLLDKVQQGLGNIRGFFHHSQSEAKDTVSKAPEKISEKVSDKTTEVSGKSSELSKILESQAEVLKTKYSALRDDQPHGEELVTGQKNVEGQESQGGKGLFGRVSGAIHNITDKFSHGASNIEGKITETKDKVVGKEEPKKAESPREKIYEFHPEAKKVEEKEKSTESQEKQPGFVSRISGTFSHGLEGVKERFHHSNKEESNETSTEKNQSVFEKIQGKIQGKQTGEEVDKQGFKKVHDGFSETVDELKHEQNEQFLEQVHVVNENPFEPLRTKQAALIDHPVTNTELVGGNLKKMTANFDESNQEMIQEEDDEKKRGLLQKMKDGLFSKFSHGNKENEESA